MGGRAIISQAIFYQKFDNGVSEVLSCWLGINLMVSFKDITQNMFCNLAETSHTVACTKPPFGLVQATHPVDLEIYYFNMELTIELY